MFRFIAHKLILRKTLVVTWDFLRICLFYFTKDSNKFVKFRKCTPIYHSRNYVNLSIQFSKIPWYFLGLFALSRKSAMLLGEKFRFFTHKICHFLIKFRVLRGIFELFPGRFATICDSRYYAYVSRYYANICIISQKFVKVACHLACTLCLPSRIGFFQMNDPFIQRNSVCDPDN